MRLPSIAKALLRNRYRLGLMLSLLTLTVFVIVTVSALTFYVANAELRAWKAPLTHFSIIQPRANSIPENILKSIRQHHDVKALLPFYDTVVSVPGIASVEYRPVFAIRQDDRSVFLEETELCLLKGSLPTPNSREIALSIDIVKAKGLHIGDYIGQAVNDNEFLWGRFQLTGILNGPISIGIISLDYCLKKGITPDSFAVFPSKHLSQMNSLLDDLSKTIRVETLSTFLDKQNQKYANLRRLMGIIVTIVVSSTTFILVLFAHLYLDSRKKEFCFFYSKGLTRQRIARFVFLELMFATLFSWLLGLLLSIVALWSIRTLAFPDGVLLVTVSSRDIYLSLPIPVTFIAISLVVINRHLSVKRLVNIVAGE